MDEALKPYLQLARPGHWIKNIFILPGVIIAAHFLGASSAAILPRLLVGFASVCLVASANYVMNEWVDAPYDQYHPIKKHRPSVRGTVKKPWVILEYALLLVGGLLLAEWVSSEFFWVSLVLLFMGVLYNLHPFRTKDVAYLDVIVESFNNPLRLTLGWFIVSAHPFPPISLFMAYWCAGAFLMAAKRYAEVRCIGDTERAALYRRSFGVYTESTLILSCFLYALSFAFFFAIFMVKYRIELLLSLPLFVVLFVWYLQLAMRCDVSVEEPQLLPRRFGFAAFMVLFIIVLWGLLTVDIPTVHVFLRSAFAI